MHRKEREKKNNTKFFLGVFWLGLRLYILTPCIKKLHLISKERCHFRIEENFYCGLEKNQLPGSVFLLH